MLNKIALVALTMTISLFTQMAIGQETHQAPVTTPNASTSADSQKQEANQSVPRLRALAGRAHANKDYEGYRQAMSQLHELRPNNSEYMYHLVLANALLDDKEGAFNMMLQMQRQGLSYDFNQTDSSMNLRKTQLYGYLNDLMVDAGQPLGNATTVASLGEDVLFPEGIEWDASREAFLVSTVRNGSILQVGLDGERKELIKADESNRVWGIYDIAVDAERNRLWAVSSANEDYEGFEPADKGRSVLLEYDLNSLELIKRYPVPFDGLPHSLRHVTAAPNGDVFIIDGIHPIVYRKAASEKSLKPMSAYKRLVSLRGMDISDDGRFLYIADYELGVVVLNLENMQSSVLIGPDNLNLGGIAGINYWDGNLIIIQNGIKPQRIMNLGLDASGTAVTNVAAQVVNLEMMDYPSYGTVVGDELFFFANSHWATTMEDAKPVFIAKTLLSEAPSVVALDAEKFKRDYAKAQLSGDAKKVDMRKFKGLSKTIESQEEKRE